MGFCLVHSDTVAILAENNPTAINPALIEVIVTSTDDTRSIYALKIARSIPTWSDISEAAMMALLFASSPKKLEAMWLINQRGSIEELLSFAKKWNISIPNPPLGIANIRFLTREIVRTSSNMHLPQIAYAINLKDGPLSLTELNKLSAYIHSLLKK